MPVRCMCCRPVCLFRVFLFQLYLPCRGVRSLRYTYVVVGIPSCQMAAEHVVPPVKLDHCWRLNVVLSQCVSGLDQWCRRILIGLLSPRYLKPGP